MSLFDHGAPIVSIIAIYLARVLELKTRRDIVPGPVRERLTLAIFVIAGTIMFGGSVAEFFLRGQKLHWATFILGWACALASFNLRRRAIAALGKFWSLHVEIRENHQFVQSGPFRWMRHPTYSSMMLELLAGGLIMNAYCTLFIVSLIFLPTLAVRVRLEEAALVEKFGEAYKRYQRSTPALLPYKWPH